MNSVWLAGGVFLITYALIVTERVDRTVSALLGGVAMILLGLLSQEQAFHAVDWNVIFLLAGMMIIANIVRETGLFQWIAVKAVRLGRGNPFTILIILVLVTAVGSALLDNVTVVVSRPDRDRSGKTTLLLGQQGDVPQSEIETVDE